MSGSVIGWSASSSSAVNSTWAVVTWRAPSVLCAMRVFTGKCTPRRLHSARVPLLSRSERQASILRGASRAFARTGFAGTSMDDVAAECGVTKLILYRHFDTKEDLYRAVLQRVFERHGEELAARMEGG